MKCCLCGEVKKSFLLNTDLCTSCSGKLSERGKDKIVNYIPANMDMSGLKGSYPHGAFYLYRWIGEEGILYIGKSYNIIARIQNHLRESPFNILVKGLELRELDSQVDMDIEELIEINNTETLYNKKISTGECSFSPRGTWFYPEDINSQIQNIYFKKEGR